MLGYKITYYEYVVVIIVVAVVVVVFFVVVVVAVAVDVTDVSVAPCFFYEEIVTLIVSTYLGHIILLALF